MINARPQYSSQLEFIQIKDFEDPGGLEEAIAGVDAIIHAASVSFTFELPHGADMTAFHIRYGEQRKGIGNSSNQWC